MKPISHFFMLFFMFSAFARAEIIIPDLLSYDKPEFLYVAKKGASSIDDPYSGLAPIVEYLAKGGRETNFRQFNIGIRAVGFHRKEGNVIEYTKITPKEVKALMLKKLSKRSTNKPKVEEIEVGGRNAYRVYSVIPMPQIHEGVIFHFEYIWIPIGPNKLIELKLVGSDKKLLKSVKDSLSTLKFHKK